MSIKTIRLELARNKGQPSGDPGHAYEFRAPLDEANRFNRFRWAIDKEVCTVKRFENGIEVEQGLLVLTPSGKWVFSYKPGEADDETVFRLSAHKFVPGEYISVTEHDGIERTFRISAVNEWKPFGAKASA